MVAKTSEFVTFTSKILSSPEQRKIMFSAAIGSGFGLMPTSTVSVMVAVPPVQRVYVIAAV